MRWTQRIYWTGVVELAGVAIGMLTAIWLPLAVAIAIATVLAVGGHIVGHAMNQSFGTACPEATAKSLAEFQRDDPSKTGKPIVPPADSDVS